MFLAARFRDWELGRAPAPAPTPLTDAEPVRIIACAFSSVYLLTN